MGPLLLMLAIAFVAILQFVPEPAIIVHPVYDMPTSTFVAETTVRAFDVLDVSRPVPSFLSTPKHLLTIDPAPAPSPLALDAPKAPLVGNHAHTEDSYYTARALTIAVFLALVALADTLTMTCRSTTSPSGIRSPHAPSSTTSIRLSDISSSPSKTPGTPDSAPAGHRHGARISRISNDATLALPPAPASAGTSSVLCFVCPNISFKPADALAASFTTPAMGTFVRSNYPVVPTENSKALQCAVKAPVTFTSVRGSFPRTSFKVLKDLPSAINTPVIGTSIRGSRPRTSINASKTLSHAVNTAVTGTPIRGSRPRTSIKVSNDLPSAINTPVIGTHTRGSRPRTSCKASKDISSTVTTPVSGPHLRCSRLRTSANTSNDLPSPVSTPVTGHSFRGSKLRNSPGSSVTAKVAPQTTAPTKVSTPSARCAASPPASGQNMRTYHDHKCGTQQRAGKISLASPRTGPSTRIFSTRTSAGVTGALSSPSPSQSPTARIATMRASAGGLIHRAQPVHPLSGGSAVARPRWR